MCVTFSWFSLGAISSPHCDETKTLSKRRKTKEKNKREKQKRKTKEKNKREKQKRKLKEKIKRTKIVAILFRGFFQFIYCQFEKDRYWFGRKIHLLNLTFFFFLFFCFFFFFLKKKFICFLFLFFFIQRKREEDAKSFSFSFHSPYKKLLPLPPFFVSLSLSLFSLFFFSPRNKSRI